MRLINIRNVAELPVRNNSAFTHMTTICLRLARHVLNNGSRKYWGVRDLHCYMKREQFGYINNGHLERASDAMNHDRLNIVCRSSASLHATSTTLSHIFILEFYAVKQLDPHPAVVQAPSTVAFPSHLL